MLKRIADLLRNAGPAPAVETDAFGEIELAVAMLMVEAARMDDEFDANEHKTITQLLARRFELDPARADKLVSEAETKVQDNAELYRLSRTVKDAFEHEDRVELMQMLWEVAYADGELHSFEANMMRRLAGLVYVTDQESGEARKRARERLGLADDA
jgi:uncharacterized tellurite resistance protein B-like protein